MANTVISASVLLIILALPSNAEPPGRSVLTHAESQEARSTALAEEEKAKHEDRPSQGADLLTVKGEWREIPLIADRVHEFAKESTFTYCVQSPLDIVERFYRAELEKLGWRQKERRWIEQSTFGGHMVLVSFEGSMASAVLTIGENPAEGHTMISLARFEKPRD